MEKLSEPEEQTPASHAKARLCGGVFNSLLREREREREQQGKSKRMLKKERNKHRCKERERNERKTEKDNEILQRE